MTPESDAALEPAACRELGYLMVSGKRVATLQCEKSAGHAAADSDMPSFLPGTPHAAVFTWDDAAPEVADDWPERHDPNEVFDVDVPLLEHDDIDAQLKTLDVGITQRRAEDHDYALRVEAARLVMPDEDDDDVLDAIARSRYADRIVDGLRESGD
jgi:hypothetical protein